MVMDFKQIYIKYVPPQIFSCHKSTFLHYSRERVILAKTGLQFYILKGPHQNRNGSETIYFITDFEAEHEKVLLRSNRLPVDVLPASLLQQLEGQGHTEDLWQEHLLVFPEHVGIYPLGDTEVRGRWQVEHYLVRT